MSDFQPDADPESTGQDRTPYEAPEAAGPGAVDDDTDLDDLEPAMSPAEEVQLRRDLQLELERFEQGMEG